MNVNIDFKKIYNDYAKDKIEDLGFIKANIGSKKECIKGIAYKLNYIDKGFRKVHPAYCVAPENFYRDDKINQYLKEQNEHLVSYCGDDPEGLIICSKEKNKYVVKYSAGQMVTPFYPILANMTFTKVDTKFHNIINEYWDELYLDEDMQAGIESELDRGDGSGDGLFKDLVNIYLCIDKHHNTKILDKNVIEFKKLFDRYKISVPSLNKLCKILHQNTNGRYLKQALLRFIYDIDNLSINNEKLRLRDKETTIKPIEKDLRQLKQSNRKKDKDAR